ncbi:MAG: hypothetical protein Q7K65_03110 [Candidatus Buchananbacteria bacterium]|nr:hypothetical protein [Candidatus Buchananbacteria bacterium]
MKRLIENGLFGAGLISLRTPEMVARYNATLEGLGVKPTSLKQFSIDGIGWSPEIAHEQGDNFYLAHGVANQLAIIATPDQDNMPIHFPFTSYNRRMMKEYFEKFRREIADLTGSAFIFLDIDPEMVDFESPMDLLLIDHIIIRSEASGLIEAARKQKDLLDQFQDDRSAWFDQQLRQDIIESAKKYGDLRFRSINIPNMKFSDLRYFYTRAFNGVFVFCDLENANHHSVLIMEDEDQYKSVKINGQGIYYLGDSKIIDRLTKYGLIEIDLEWYRNNLDELRKKRGALILSAICENYPDIDYGKTTSPKKKSLIKDLGDRMPKVFFQLQRLIKQLTIGQIPTVSNLSPSLKRILIHPASSLAGPDREVVWQMICKICPLEVLRLYVSDKDLFFREYLTWPEAKKKWVVEFLKENYTPEMEKEEL